MGLDAFDASPLGAFLESPVGARGLAGAITGGHVINVTGPVADRYARYQTFAATCGVAQERFRSGHEYKTVAFEWVTAAEIPLGDIVTKTITGDTSGASWDLSTHSSEECTRTAAGTTFVTFWEPGGLSFDSFYPPSSMVAVTSNVVTWVLQIGVIWNEDAYPTYPAFVDGEAVTVA